MNANLPVTYDCMGEERTPFRVAGFAGILNIMANRATSSFSRKRAVQNSGIHKE